MLVSSKLYHLLPDGILKIIFSDCLVPLVFMLNLVPRSLVFINGKKIEYLSHSIQIHMNNMLQY